MKFIILHGTSAAPTSNWFEWLDTQLVKQGHQVWTPQLPNADQPNIVTYLNFLLGPTKPFDIDDQTILVGHSSGAVAILHLLQALPSTIKPSAAVLVSAFANDLGWSNLSNLFITPLNLKALAHRGTQLIFIHSDNDPYVPLDQAQHLAHQTAGRLIIIPGQGHFNTELSPSYHQFPQLLHLINSI